MEIRVVQGDPKIQGAWPHYCRRYGVARAVIDCVRPCPHCRAERAQRMLPVLRHELGLLAKAVADDERAARRRMSGLAEDTRAVLDAMAELDEVEATLRQAVKIGWSAKRPVAVAAFPAYKSEPHNAWSWLVYLSDRTVSKPSYDLLLTGSAVSGFYAPKRY